MNLFYDVGKAMLTEIRKRRFTREEYHRLVDAGILREDDRLELIDGEIFEMSPINKRHAACVLRMSTFFTRSFQQTALVSAQGPLRLNQYSEPQPDVIVLKPRDDFYGGEWTPRDVLLLVEVSDTTLKYDREVKLPRYAAAGIPEAWIADVNENLLFVYREPSGDGYKTELTLHYSDSVSPLAFPESIFKVEDLLG
jgi:Uma2 family endonuclease